MGLGVYWVVLPLYFICLLGEIDFWGAGWDNGINWLVVFPSKQRLGKIRSF